MKFTLSLIGLLGLSAFLLLAPDVARADITADTPVAYATSPQQKNGAVFLRLENNGEVDDTLSVVTSEIAERTELHETITQPNAQGVDMSSMRPVDSIKITPSNPVAFEPMGKHIMLIGLKKQLVAGESFPLTLHFEKAGEMKTKVQIVDRSYELKH